ncbi:MAG: effector-associated domain EAD1-containing protein, partial [Acidimicrobiia bacterium]|nr:effector-associated domain EAD1-containing protein [Acidimicrobiia bacterium]
MTLELDGRQRRDLREALIDGFPNWGDLEAMVADQLDQNLAVLAPQSADLEQVVFELIKWAGARGRLGDLIAGARNANPDNPKLFKAAEAVGFTS